MSVLSHIIVSDGVVILADVFRDHAGNWIARSIGSDGMNVVRNYPADMEINHRLALAALAYAEQEARGLTPRSDWRTIPQLDRETASG